MKIQIKKFMELQNVSFTTPVKIEAGHDVGKSTIFRSVLFAITGKDVNGKDFDGCIYPKKSEMLEDLQVEVQIEQSGVIFTKIAKGSEKRQKGSEITELQRSVTATYMIDYKVVGKSEYDSKIADVFGNFQLLCNPDYFRNLDKIQKRAIFASLVEIDKNSYFSAIPDKTTTNGKLSEQRAAIAAKQANLQEFQQVQKPEAIETVDYKSKIEKLQKQRNEMQPVLNDLQKSENQDINRLISEIEKSVFIPKRLIPVLPGNEKPTYHNVEELQRELINIQISEPNVSIFDITITRMKAKIDYIKSLSLQIENYHDNVLNSKCTVCQVCSSPNCEFKRIEIKPISELQEEFSRLMPLQSAEKSLENAESEKIDYLRNFEAKKAEDIEIIQNKISKFQEANEKMKFDYEISSELILKQNAEIAIENEEITIENSRNYANFEAEKAEKIQGLKSRLHQLPEFNPVDIDDEIRGLQKLNEIQQGWIDIYNKNVGSYEHAQKRISEISVELQEMKSVLIGYERDLIAYEAAEKQYYTDFEAKINSEMPENVKVFLFKKNLSNDGYSEVFDIEFNGSIYAGNGKTIAFYIFLCSWFQSKFGVDLPIFIDEAIILQDKLYSNVKNAVILMRNDNYSTLKITES